MSSSGTQTQVPTTEFSDLPRGWTMPPHYAGSRLAREWDRRRLGDAGFSIVSNDCWAAELYKRLRRPFNTPFVGNFIFGPDFTRLVTNLDQYLREPLKMGVSSRYVASPTYPIGVIGEDVEIHFLHYTSSDDAKEKWQRRLERFEWGAVRIKVSAGKDLIDDATLDAVRSHTGGLVLCRRALVKGDIVVPRYTDNGRALFRRSIRRFDFVEWLRTGVLGPAPPYARLLP